MVQRICLVSSGTGGHLLPAVVLAEALEARGHSTVLLTEGRPSMQLLLDRCGRAVRPLALGHGRMRRPLSFGRAALRSRALLRVEDVDLVVGTGGSATVPVALAARSLGLPVCLMEQNATAGRANRWLLPFARRIYLGLPSTRQLPRSLLTGTPIRRELGQIERVPALESLGLTPTLPVLLVTGGSQGASAINEIAPRALLTLRRPLQVVHLSGAGADDDVRSRYAAAQEHGVDAIVRPMVLDMATMYAAADLVVCRGGGGTVAELMAAGRAAIIVPYPWHKDRQQWHNARVLECAGAAVVIEQHELTVARLAQAIGDLLCRPAELVAMGERARSLAPHDACSAILEDLARVGVLDG